MKHKKISFEPKTKDPEITVKCGTCGHRNVPPKMRDMLACPECNKSHCWHCIQEGDICVDCKMGRKSVDDPRPGTDRFRHFCLKCDLEIESGILCFFCDDFDFMNLYLDEV